MSLFAGLVRIPDGAMILAVAMQAETTRCPADAITRLRRGDVNALGQVLPQYQTQLYRFLLRMVREPALAEDLFQQTWVRVIQKIGTYDAQSRFESWLYSIARNMAVDHLRRKREWSLEATEDQDSGIMGRMRVAGPDPLEQLLESERGSILAAALEKLPAIHVEVLTLRFEQGMKLEEIAEVVGIPISTVKSRLYRAMEDLKKQVTAECGLGGKK